MVNSSHEYSFVSNDVIEKFFDILKNNHPEKVYLVGGEVLLHIDRVEEIVKRVRQYCDYVMIFSNGTFLLNPEKEKRVEEMGVIVRISDDRYHRKQWSEELKEKIYASKRYVVKPDDGTLDYIIPVGRAYEAFKESRRIPDCSLYTGIYDERYKNHHRYMIMMNGDVNLYCATVEGALANVFEDDVTYELMVEREKIFHNYLFKNVILREKDHYMAALCNQCQRYKVTSESILFDGQIVADTKDYLK